MRVKFVSLGHEHLAISILSALAKRHGHESSLAYFNALFNDNEFPQFKVLSNVFDDSKDVLNSIINDKPDVLALTASTSEYRRTLRIAKEVKERYPEVVIVIGGSHVSAVPERAIIEPLIDYLVIGEGDIAFIKILDAISKRDFTSPIENTWFKNAQGVIIKGKQIGFVQDLSSLPQFDKEIWAEHIPLGDLYRTMTARGCPFKCTYCFNNYFRNIPEEHPGKYLRRRSVEHVMEELITSKKRYNIKYIDFWDDVFTFDKKWLKEFLYQYKKEINVPYICYAHAQYFDEDIAKMLKESGCEWAQIGVQTLDENYKKKWLCRNEINEDISRALDLMSKYKIKSKTDIMIGLPGEPEEAQHASVDFFAKHTPTNINVYWYNYLPGTELTNIAYKENFLSKERLETILEGNDVGVYRRPDMIFDTKTVKKLQSFSLLYRIYPRIPRFLRIKSKKAERIPYFIKRILSPINGIFLLLSKSPREIFLFQHSFFQLKKLIAYRFRKRKQ